MEAYKKGMMIMGLLVVVMIGLIDGSNGQGISICNMPANVLESCLPSVSGENQVDPPYLACCAALAKADLKCFCRYKDSGLLAYYGIDPNEAMKLPSKCKVVSDPNWHC